jgi:hypothetical protein
MPLAGPLSYRCYRKSYRNSAGLTHNARPNRLFSALTMHSLTLMTSQVSLTTQDPNHPELVKYIEAGSQDFSNAMQQAYV